VLVIKEIDQIDGLREDVFEGAFIQLEFFLLVNDLLPFIKIEI
jgi:hypothetical protein